MSDESQRATIRKFIAALLEAHLVHSLERAERVVPFRTSDISSAPLVVVASDGTDTSTLTFDKKQDGMFFYSIYIFAPSAAGDWTEAMAADRSDFLEEQVRFVLTRNTKNAYWQDVGYVERSRRGNVKMGGKVYMRELISIWVRVF